MIIRNNQEQTKVTNRRTEMEDQWGAAGRQVAVFYQYAD
jgi:hypothetical protein